MNNAKSLPKSQTELIIEYFLNNLEQHPEFDEVILAKLRNLVLNGNLTKHTLIEAAVMAQTVKNNEDN